MRQLLNPGRLRIVEKPFGWMPFRLITDGYWQTLSCESRLLYCVLSLVSDRYGLSFYGEHRLEKLLGAPKDKVVSAREELLRCDLIDFRRKGNVYQLLSLPQRTNDDPQTCQVPSGTTAPVANTHNDSTAWRINPQDVREVIDRLSRKIVDK
jgi:hypothetical protein